MAVDLQTREFLARELLKNTGFRRILASHIPNNIQIMPQFCFSWRERDGLIAVSLEKEIYLAVASDDARRIALEICRHEDPRDTFPLETLSDRQLKQLFDES